MIWAGIAILVALIAALPWIVEARRRPMKIALQDRAPGHFAELKGGRTHYQWFGAPPAPTLVLVHGLSSPSWVFDGLVHGFMQSGYRVLSYDLFGRGYSARAAGRQTLDFHAAQLEELLDTLGIETTTVLGYSMGGAIAARFAEKAPERVERLILLAPAGMLYAPGPLLGFAGRAGVLGTWVWMLLGGRVLRQAARADAGEATAIADLPARIGTELSHRGYLPAVLSSQRNSLSVSLEAAHREIAAMYIPTLAVWGEQDRIIPIASVGQLAAWNHGAHQEVIPGAGHGLAYTHPQEVLAAVRSFLREVPD